MPSVTLAEQIIEVEKTVRDRARQYPDLVARGRLRQETADAKLAALRAVQSTLTWLEANHDWIKAEAASRRRAGGAQEKQAAAQRAAIAPDPARVNAGLDDLDALLAHPAAAAVRAAFPDATVVGVHTIAPPSARAEPGAALSDPERETEDA